jgi:hypothetical protein
VVRRQEQASVSEFHSDTDQAFISLVEMMRGAIGGMQGQMLGMDRFEYKLVPVHELSEHGADRWRVVPVPPSMEVKVVLGQPQPGPMSFLMERQVIVDETAMPGLLGAFPFPQWSEEEQAAAQARLDRMRQMEGGSGAEGA